MIDKRSAPAAMAETPKEWPGEGKLSPTRVDDEENEFNLIVRFDIVA
jgi:hypothetical protein